jgi:hypothetical protein
MSPAQFISLLTSLSGIKINSLLLRFFKKKDAKRKNRQQKNSMYLIKHGEKVRPVGRA